MAGAQRIQILLENARQLLKTVQATFPNYGFEPGSLPTDCDDGLRSGVEGVQCAWFQVLQHLRRSEKTTGPHSEIELALLHFSKTAQNVMSSTSSNYDLTRLNSGLYTGGLAALLSFPATYRLLSKFRTAGIFLLFGVLGYGAMMFASSYVEEEQQFWYWFVTSWVFYLHIRSSVKGRENTYRSSASAAPRDSHALLLSIARAGSPICLFICYRFLRHWNQTGQKSTVEPDVARDFFPIHQNTLWFIVILTYADTCWRLLRSMPTVAVWHMTTVIVTLIAFAYKLNSVASDSPELLNASFLGPIGDIGLSLVSQARLVFGGIALLMLFPVCVNKMISKLPGTAKGKC